MTRVQPSTRNYSSRSHKINTPSSLPLSRVNAAHYCCCLDAALCYWLMVPYLVSMPPPQQRSRMAKACTKTVSAFASNPPAN